MAENKFPSEVIDLPSEGKLYPKEHPCSDGKVEIKYMTAKEEDILTSQNLIKKGVVIDRLIDSLILTPGVKQGDMILGDKNAVMVAARILAYGPEYPCEVTNPKSGEVLTHTFNLADCPFKKLPEGVSENNFEVTLPISKKKVTFKLLTGAEEKVIDEELQASKKTGSDVSPELEIAKTQSVFFIPPKSPWLASVAWIKYDGVPVDVKVAAILLPICALFPIPVTITLPLILLSSITAL